jgi:hypothetical protein
VKAESEPLERVHIRASVSAFTYDAEAATTFIDDFGSSYPGFS